LGLDLQGVEVPGGIWENHTHAQQH
jgi:hypothetical protein